MCLSASVRTPAWVAAMRLNSACTLEGAERGQVSAGTACYELANSALVCPICTHSAQQRQRAVGTVDDIDQRIPGHWATRRWLETSQQDPRQLPQKQRLPGKPAPTPRLRPWKCLSHSAELDPMAEIIEANAGTMVDNDDNKRRRLVEFKDGCR
jgi:hypothetical protein